MHHDGMPAAGSCPCFDSSAGTTEGKGLSLIDVTRVIHPFAISKRELADDCWCLGAVGGLLCGFLASRFFA